MPTQGKLTVTLFLTLSLLPMGALAQSVQDEEKPARASQSEERRDADAIRGRTDEKAALAKVRELRKRWRQVAPAFEGNPFLEMPVLRPPFAPGRLHPDFVRDALNLVNFARGLAGLPEDVVVDDDLMTQAQYGALLLGAVNRLDHNPPQPPGMDDDIYRLGYTSTSHSNIALGQRSIVDSLLYYLDDSDARNIEKIGHRRWLLHPPLKRIGFGFVSLLPGARGNTTTQVFDRSRKEAVKFGAITWPAAGVFPVELFHKGQVWSVSLNPQTYLPPDAAKVRVTLRRAEDGAAWEFAAGQTPNTEDGTFFNVDTHGYGLPNCLIFRPGRVGGYAPGDLFRVEITGLRHKDGSPATVRYEVRFFALAERP